MTGIAGDVAPPQAPGERHADRPTEDAGTSIAVGATLAGFAPEQLADRYGTPFFIYDLDVVTRRAATLRAAMPAVVDIAYAAKANPALAVVAHVASLGLGIDVASGGELDVVGRVGVPAQHIVFTGPGKRDDELRRAVRAGIRAITVESRGELERLERIAAAEGRVVPIMLRVASTGEDTSGERVRIIGDAGTGKFGMDRDDLRLAARTAVRSRHLQPLGVHAFGASNVLDVETLAAHAARTVDLASELAAGAGFQVRLVDVGGGLGIPYRDDDEELDLAALGRRLASIVHRARSEPAMADVRLLIEPGRYLVGPAGAYVARVVDEKRVDGRCVVVLDGGIHHLLRPALVREEHRIAVVGRDGTAAPHAARVTVAGPLCSGLDILALDAPMPVPAVGDLVALRDAGAYGYTESMPFFLSHPVPAEVAARGGRAERIRRRIEPDELLALQRIPSFAGADG